MKSYIEFLVVGERSPRYLEIGEYSLVTEDRLLVGDTWTVNIANLVYYRILDEAEYESIFREKILDQDI